MIKLINVTKVYPNGVKALSDISLTINMGEFVFLVGSSGAGKSTLIRLLFREEVPTSGYLMIAGKNINRLKIEIPVPAATWALSFRISGYRRTAMPLKMLLLPWKSWSVPKRNPGRVPKCCGGGAAG